MTARETSSISTTRRALWFALGLNTAVCLIEFAAGYHGNSLALLLDGFHNCSDELALALLVISYTKFSGNSRALDLSANSLNTFGIATVAVTIVYFSLRRIFEPTLINGELTMGAALLAALGNQLVALSLRQSAKSNPAIGLAYVHNVGDVAACLTIAFSGAMIHFTGVAWLDPLLALGIAIYLLLSAMRELKRFGTEFVYQSRAVKKKPIPQD